jgi:hypothetical protein
MLLLQSKAAWADNDGADARTAHDGVPVKISGVLRTVTLRIVSDDTGEPVAFCRGPCAFHARPGRFTAWSFDEESGERHEIGLRVRRASHFNFEPGDDTERTAGLIVGIAGPTLILTGFILVAPVLLSSMCEESNCTSEGQQTAGKIGVGALLLGAIATPIGWSMFSSGRTRFVQTSTEDTSTQRLFSLRLSLAGAPGGLGIAGSGRF